MSRRVVLHCGFHKTGSTLIQKALRASKSILDKHSVHFFSLPDLNRLELRPLLHRLATRGPDGSELEHLKETMGKEAKAAPQEVFLLSFEGLLGNPPSGFYRLAGAKLRLLLEVFAPLETSVIVYIKRQDRMLESIYKQRIQMGGTLDVPAFLRTIKFEDMSWERLLADIEAVVGMSRMCVRLAEDLSHGEQEHLNAFLSLVVGHALEERFEVPRDTNQSYSELALRIALVLNSILDEQQLPQFRQLLRKHFNDGKKPEILDTASRKEILSFHGPGNASVFRRYRPGKDPALYQDPDSQA